MSGDVIVLTLEVFFRANCLLPARSAVTLRRRSERLSFHWGCDTSKVGGTRISDVDRRLGILQLTESQSVVFNSSVGISLDVGRNNSLNKDKPLVKDEFVFIHLVEVNRMNITVFFNLFLMQVTGFLKSVNNFRHLFSSFHFYSLFLVKAAVILIPRKTINIESSVRVALKKKKVCLRPFRGLMRIHSLDTT